MEVLEGFDQEFYFSPSKGTASFFVADLVYCVSLFSASAVISTFVSWNDFHFLSFEIWT